MLIKYFYFRAECICDWKRRAGWWIRHRSRCVVLLRTRTWIRHQHSPELTVRSKLKCCTIIFILFHCSLWPQFVKQRIQDTYMYFGASIGISAASAVAVFRNPTLLNLVSRSGWMALIGTFAVVNIFRFSST